MRLLWLIVVGALLTLMTRSFTELADPAPLPPWSQSFVTLAVASYVDVPRPWVAIVPIGSDE